MQQGGGTVGKNYCKFRGRKKKHKNVPIDPNKVPFVKPRSSQASMRD